MSHNDSNNVSPPSDRQVITVDGVGASGKSALARMLADRLGFAHLNSGLLYRAAAFLAERAKVPLTAGDLLAAEVARHQLQLRHDPILGSVVVIDGVVREAELMSRAISEGASQVAKHQAVRNLFLAVQRTAFLPLGIVAEGRDMGTVVFPDAPVKFFVDARLEIRAARRVEQLRAKGQGADIESVSAELAARDERDATRATAPMKPASGAVIVDNSDTPLEQTVELMLGLVRSRMWAGSQR